MSARNSAAPNILVADGAKIEYLDLPGQGPVDVVLLHEGLGSVAMWRDFPAQVAAATGARTLAYSRRGYGKSDPANLPRRTDYMHEEARVALPAVLAARGITRPVLIGHSDGASIAILYAARHDVAGLILMAPHVFVEDITIASIEEAKTVYKTTALRDRLGRYHDDVDHAFWGWNDIWLHPDFRAWNIEAALPKITAPVLIIQGEDDQYGTVAQVDAIERQVAGPCRRLMLPACKHSPHRDQPDATLSAISDFVAKIAAR